MKARDIIAGWPRGKSTTAVGNWRWNPIFMSKVGCYRWTLKEFRESESNFQSNLDYHASQAEMVDRHLWGQYRQDLNAILSGRATSWPFNRRFLEFTPRGIEL